MLLRRSFILIFIFAVLTGFEYVFLDIENVLPSFLLTLLFLFVVYINKDRIFLIIIGAREVSEVEYADLYQIVKNKAFLSGLVYPKIYTYNGNLKKAYVLSSRNRLSLVLERSLVVDLGEDEAGGLVDKLFEDSKGLRKNKTLFYFFASVASFTINLLVKLFRTLGVPRKYREGITLPFWGLLYSIVYFFKLVLIEFKVENSEELVYSKLPFGEKTDMDKIAIYKGLKSLLEASFEDRGKLGSIIGIESIS